MDFGLAGRAKQNCQNWSKVCYREITSIALPATSQAYRQAHDLIKNCDKGISH